MAKTLIGTITTDENGIATFEYIATGAGEVKLIAESDGLISNELTILDMKQLYADETTHTYSMNSVNNNIGHYHYEIWYTTTEDVYVSCIVKQTAAGTWYNAGLTIAYGSPITDTTTNRNNGTRIMLAGSNFNGSNGQHKQYVAGQSNTGPDMVFNREYLLEVTRKGNTFTNKITDLTTNTVTREATYTYTGTQELKHWCFSSFEGCTFYYRDVKIFKI